MKRGSFYRAKYNKLVFRLGCKNKAKVAIANRLARAIYKILAGDKYKELGYMRKRFIGTTASAFFFMAW